MEKIFPTERAVPGHRMRIVGTVFWPVTGLMAGTPVLMRKLTAGQRDRRAEAAALKGKSAELLAEADQFEQEAFAKKLAEADPVKRPAMIHAREAARVAAKEAAAEQAKADRKASRSKLGDSAGAGALLLIVGGPLVWSLARPLIGPGIGLLIGAWWIAALMHVPASGKAAPDVVEEPAAGTTPVPPAETPDDPDEWIQDSPPEAVLWALIRHTAALTKQGTAAHLQAVLDEARRRGEMTDWKVPDLAEELASYGVPVVEGKKLTISGRNLNRKAVLLAALPETDPAPVPAIVQPAAKSAA